MQVQNLFTTFYSESLHPNSEIDYFDVCSQSAQSTLTCLHFKLNKDVREYLPKKFTITLYPNPILVIP